MMLFVYLKTGFPVNDKEFDQIYPEHIQDISKKNWTPVEVAIKAARFLVKDASTRVLDIGSGVGKFCLIGACITEGEFTGVEQRKHLVEISKNLIRSYNIPNIKIVNANIESVNFQEYDSFYLFNPFYENFDNSPKIDSSVQFSPDLYDTYSRYVKEQLDLMPVGTRIVTYHCSSGELPVSYELSSSDYNGKLNYWTKTKNIPPSESFFIDKLVKNGVSRLKRLGFKNVNEQNIMQDDVYKIYFKKILKSKLGQMEFTDNTIKYLIKKLK